MADEEKMTKIYVSKTTGMVAISVFVIVIALVLLVFYQAYGGRTLINPTERLKPLGKILGSQDKDVQQVAGDKKDDSSKLTIVFYYEGYQSQEAALVDIEVFKKAIELVEPFKSLKGNLSYKVFTADSEKCKVDSSTRYLVCDKELIDSFRALGTDRFKVVLIAPKDFIPAAESARGKNSWISISTTPSGVQDDKKREWMGIMVTRLLAYSLGVSYETGDKTPEVTIPPEAIIESLSYNGRPNCAPNKETAEKWWGSYTKIFPNIQYFQGCGGHKDYYYPQEGTLMSLDPKKETYGLVSEDYLRGVLTCFYGKKDDIVYPAGKQATYSASLQNCEAFTSQYSNFWAE